MLRQFNGFFILIDCLKQLFYAHSFALFNHNLSVEITFLVNDTFFNITTPKFAAQAIKKAAEIGWKIAYTQWGIFIALVFVGLPFVTRTVQPVVEEIEREVTDRIEELYREVLISKRRSILPLTGTTA